MTTCEAGLLPRRRSRAGTAARCAKAVLDWVAAAVLLLLLSPGLAVIAVAVRLGDGGPVLYRQDRLGHRARPFAVYKFRTMVVDADARMAALHTDNDGDGLLFKMRADPRVTRVGRQLRRFSLDELPQLLNVLRGEMSLVGPRPLPVLDVDAYSSLEQRRFEVKPGITGLWQVSGRSDLSWQDAVALDVRYVDQWSLALDLHILLRTVPAVVTGAGAY